VKGTKEPIKTAYILYLISLVWCVLSVTPSQPSRDAEDFWLWFAGSARKRVSDKNYTNYQERCELTSLREGKRPSVRLFWWEVSAVLQYLHAEELHVGMRGQLHAVSVQLCPSLPSKYVATAGFYHATLVSLSFSVSSDNRGVWPRSCEIASTCRLS
jgi:hypothetical protein